MHALPWPHWSVVMVACMRPIYVLVHELGPTTAECMHTDGRSRCRQCRSAMFCQPGSSHNAQFSNACTSFLPVCVLCCPSPHCSTSTCQIFQVRALDALHHMLQEASVLSSHLKAYKPAVMSYSSAAGHFFDSLRDFMASSGAVRDAAHQGCMHTCVDRQ
jgi:hypothetical protein